MNLGFTIGTAVADRIREEQERTRHLGFWHQIGQQSIVWVREIVEELDPIRYEVWNTREDERTCPICGRLDGLIQQEGEGFAPPLHDHCRCERVYHHIEFQKRISEHWQKHTIYTNTWEWRRLT